MDPHVWSWDTSLPGIDDDSSGTELTLVISKPDNFRQLFAEAE